MYICATFQLHIKEVKDEDQIFSTLDGMAFRTAFLPLGGQYAHSSEKK